MSVLSVWSVVKKIKRGKKMELYFKDQTYSIRGAIFEVYHEMGHGFLESVYQECLEKEFKLKKIPYISQPELKLTYKKELLNQTYRPDFICFDHIIVEIKAVKEIANEHKAQIINYLKVTGIKLGLLVNFGSYPKAQIERFVL